MQNRFRIMTNPKMQIYTLKIDHNYRQRVDFSRENHVRVSNFPPIFTAPVRKRFPALFYHRRYIVHRVQNIPSIPLYMHGGRTSAKCVTLLCALCIYLFTNFRLRINHPILPCEWLSAFDISYCTPSEARRVFLLFFADISF